MFKVEVRQKFTKSLIFFLFMAINMSVALIFKDFFVDMMLGSFESVKIMTQFGRLSDVAVKSMDLIFKGDDNVYIWFQCITNHWQIFLIAALLMGVGEFSKDREFKTVYLSLNFVSRKEYYDNKTLSGMMYLFLMMFLLFILNFVLGKAVGMSFSVGWMAMAYFQVFLAGAVFYQVICFSTLFLDRRGKGYLLMAIIFIAVIILNIFLPVFGAQMTGWNEMMEMKANYLAYAAQIGIVAAVYLAGRSVFNKLEL